MAKRKGVRFFTRSIFDVPRWIGWNSLKQNASSISQMYRSLVHVPKTPKITETFEEAVMRMNLTEADIKKSEKNYTFSANLYFGVFIVALCYHFYLVLNQHWTSAFVMVSFDAMMFSFWFRESFRLMQIKQRRLGQNFKEWVCHIFEIS